MIFFSRVKLEAKSGFAIVVTLLFLSLLTTLVISFYFKTLNQLKISEDKTRLSVAELSSKSVKTIVISDILNELSRNSTAQNDHGHLYFRPKELSHAYLSRDTIPAGNPLFYVRRSDDGFEGGRIRELEQGESTSESSRNHGWVSDGYWKKFMGESSGIRDEAPRWRYLQTTESNLSSSIKGRRQEKIRFAFRLYQLDGMMDIGGIPIQSEKTAKTSDSLFSKINFLNLGLFSSYQWFAWRYPSGKNDTETVKGTAIDSYSIGRKNRGLLGRRDFIEFMESHPNILSKNLLHLWTHCNIQKNIPTYAPATIPGSSIDYASESLKIDSVNPDFLNIRVKQEFIRRNGQLAKLGEPLVTQRFPLQYTLWLDSSSGAEASAEEIEKYFGLKRDSTDQDAWSYRLGQSKILTLGEVAKINREPDFFELLKAAILKGSLGLTMDPSVFDIDGSLGSNGSPSCLLTGTVLAPYLYSDSQIIQIGANLIDQYDTDSYATRIKFWKDDAGNEMSFFGRENLPYITRLGLGQTRYKSPSNANVDLWLRTEFWYPHDQSNLSIEKGSRPTDFKMEISGSTNFKFNGGGGLVTTPVTCGPIQITSPKELQGNQPHLLDITNSTSSDSNNISNLPGDQGVLGFYLGNINAGMNAGVPIPNLTSVFPNPSPTLKISIYYNRNGKYILYDTVLNPIPKAGVHGIPWIGATWVAYPGYYEIAPYHVTRIDSRTARFGYHMYDTKEPGLPIFCAKAPFNSTLLPDLNGSIINPNGICWYGPTNAVGLTPGAPGSPNWGGYTFRVTDFIKNKQGSGNFYYLDPDNVARKADAYYMTQEVENPLSASTNYARPLVLNRPFNSEAEMGFAHRDLPYRSIDFFSEQSADAGLLDVFSIKDLPYRRDQVNYNFSDPAIIPALLKETPLHPFYTSRGNIPESIGSQVQQSIQEEVLTSQKWKKPITNRAELLTLFSEKWGGLIKSGIKTERESIFRRLIPFFSANTWNLGLDLVVQTGYEIEQNGEKVFIKESELKSWDTIVIDPFTAEILYQEREIVY